MSGPSVGDVDTETADAGTAAPPAESWSVGELAAATGLSVRVLRHWDALGVVSPTRTGSGHRRYRMGEVTRLYQALALRRTGLALDRVADLLSARDLSPATTLRRRLVELDEDLERGRRVRDRLADALDHADGDLTGPQTGYEVLRHVIAAMTMVDGYVHGHRPVEHARLHDQATTLTELLHRDTGYPAGSEILEVGCGVGAQTVTLADRSPGARLTAIDVSQASLDRARRRVSDAGHGDAVTFRSADVTTLPHDDGPLAAGGFDHVFVCFLLEHVRRPDDVLARLRRMLRPGGSVTVIEGDHGSADFHPDSQAARDAIDCQVVLQRQAGGDALVGRHVRDLLAGAGFTDVTVGPRTVEIDADDDRPELVDGFVRRTFTAMIAGVREPAIAAGLTTAAYFDAGIADLLRTTGPGGAFHYRFTRATGYSPGDDRPRQDRSRQL